MGVEHINLNLNQEYGAVLHHQWVNGLLRDEMGMPRMSQPTLMNDLEKSTTVL